MNKILIVFIVIFLLLIVYSFQSCDKNEENFDNTSNSSVEPISEEDSVESDRYGCMDRCRMEHTGADYDNCISKC